LRLELKDHLFCEIEVPLEEGLTDQQAFSLATKKLGQPDALLDEYSKNRKIFSRMCNSNETSLSEYSQQRSHVMSYKQNSKRLLGQSIMWAAAMLSSAMLFGESENYFIYILLLFALASTSFAMDPAYKEMLRIERRYIRRLLGIGKTEKVLEGIGIISPLFHHHGLKMSSFCRFGIYQRD